MELQEICASFKQIDIQHDSAALCSPQIKEAYTLYNEALVQIRSGNIADARAKLRKATQLKPEFDDAFILLGLCIFSCGNRIDAMRAFNQINDVENHNDAMYYFDILSGNSKNVVAGHKKQQTYQETVRTLKAEKNNSLKERVPKRPVSEEFTELNFYDEDDGPAESAFPLKSEPVAEFETKIESAAENNDVADSYMAFKDEFFREESMPEDDSFFEFTPETVSSESISNYFMEFSEENTGGKAASYRESSKTAPVRTSASEAVFSSNSKSSAAPVFDVDIVYDGDTDIAAKTEKKQKIKKYKFSKSNKRLAVIACCLVVLLIVAVVVILADKDKLFGSGTGGEGSGIIAAQTASPKDKELYTDEPTEAPTESATEAPTEIPVEILQTQADETFAEAKQLMTSRAFYECYILLAQTDWTYLSQSEKSELESLKTQSFNQFCNEYFNLMYSNVGSENWEAVLSYGLVLLEHCPDYDRGAPAYFSVGKAYENTGDLENAAKYYEITIEKYPDSNDARYAKYRLSQLA